MSAAGSGALSGAASGAAAGAAFGPWGAVIGGAIGGIGGFFSGKKEDKANKALIDAQKNLKLIDIPSIVQQARDQSFANIQDSIIAEQRFDPGTARLRNSSNDFLNNALGTKDANQQRRDSILEALGGAAGQSLGSVDLQGALNQNGPLDTSNAARRDSIVESLMGAAKNFDPNAETLSQEGTAAVLADLRRGGSLDPETQAEVVRASMEGAGGSGILGSDAGRGLTARDIGMTSLQLSQLRQDRANKLAAGLLDRKDALTGAAGNLALAGYGQDLKTWLDTRGQNVDTALGEFNANLNARNSEFDRLGQAANAYSTASNNDFTRNFGIAELVNNTPRPQIGLDPGAIADMAIGNVNAQNQQGLNIASIRANGLANQGRAISSATGSILGGLGTLYAGRTPSTSGATATTWRPGASSVMGPSPVMGGQPGRSRYTPRT